MPSTVTHAYIAKDVYKKLDKKITRKITNENYNELLMFSSGFDILYFYKILSIKPYNTVTKLGATAHHSKTNEFLINLTNQIKETKNISQFMYLMGLLTHYAADSTIHPYINYKAKTITKKHFTMRDAHFQIETYLDNYFIKNRENIDYKKYKIYEELFKVERNEDIVNLLNKAFKEVFQEDNIGEYFYKAISDMKNFFHFLRYDPTGLKRKFYNFANIFASRLFRDVRYLSYNFPLDNDNFYLNLEHAEWFNLKNANSKSKKSFLELYDEVIDKASNIIEKTYEYIFEDKKVDLEKLFENKSYGDGIPLN